jgi:hypothetical protein
MPFTVSCDRNNTLYALGPYVAPPDIHFTCLDGVTNTQAITALNRIISYLNGAGDAMAALGTGQSGTFT